jgi:hypothetical protein
VSPEQPRKALLPIEVTELGIVTEVSTEQPEKALLPIEVTELGMVVFLQPTINLFVDVSIIALQLSRESYVPLFLSTVTEVSLEQWGKAELGIIVTLSPIVNEVRFVQSLKAEIISVHFSALNITEVSPVQP